MPTRALMRSPETQAAPHAFSSRHFLKMIEDTGKVGFWSSDLYSERLTASPGLYRILGLDPATEMTFGVALDMIHPDDQATHRDQIEVLRSGQAVSREFRIVRPDRTQRWILHHAEAILGPDGTPSRGMGVVFDVTAQHDATRALLQRHDRLNALIAATASVFWVNKANGEPSEMPQWMALTGQTHAQMQGLGWLDAVHPDDRPGRWRLGRRRWSIRRPTTPITGSCARTGSTAGSTPAALRSSTGTARCGNGSGSASTSRAGPATPPPRPRRRRPPPRGRPARKG